MRVDKRANLNGGEIALLRRSLESIEGKIRVWATSAVFSERR